MRRWSNVIDEIRDAYSGTEPWHVNGDTSEQEDSLNRIVCRITGAAWRDDHVGYVDDPPDRCIGVRLVHTRFELWAGDWDDLEDRMHGLQCALRTTGESDLEISNIQEPEWLTDAGITAGGACAILTCDIAVAVLLASDNEVLASGAPLNQGAPQVPVETAQANFYFNQDTDTPDLTTNKERET